MPWRLTRRARSRGSGVRSSCGAPAERCARRESAGLRGVIVSCVFANCWSRRRRALDAISTQLKAGVARLEQGGRRTTLFLSRSVVCLRTMDRYDRSALTEGSSSAAPSNMKRTDGFGLREASASRTGTRQRSKGATPAEACLRRALDGGRAPSSGWRDNCSARQPEEIAHERDSRLLASAVLGRDLPVIFPCAGGERGRSDAAVVGRDTDEHAGVCQDRVPALQLSLAVPLQACPSVRASGHVTDPLRAVGRAEVGARSGRHPGVGHILMGSEPRAGEPTRMGPMSPMSVAVERGRRRRGAPCVGARAISKARIA